MQLVALYPPVLHLRPLGVEQKRIEKISDLILAERASEFAKCCQEYLESHQSLLAVHHIEHFHPAKGIGAAWND